MIKKPLPIVKLKLDKIVGGGQAMGSMDDGRKTFVWGGLPGETVMVQLTKKKSHMAEGMVTEVITSSPDRITPTDIESYMSTSPWQIMKFAAEQHYKAALIEEAFELHDIVLPNPIEVYTDGKQFEYRNKIEFSFYFNKETEQLDLAFFKRSSHGKIPVSSTSLALPCINESADRLLNILRARDGVKGFDLKTVLVRADQNNNVAMQLYVKNSDFEILNDAELKILNVQGFELIFSNPKSPASVITRRLQQWGINNLSDTILDVPFNYAVEGFFQINLPVYEQALNDMKKWTDNRKSVIDLYSGVGSIGLTIGGKKVTLIESNEHAVNEMRQNIIKLGREKTTTAILSPSEFALDHIDSKSIIIVDPPRAGMHTDVIKKLLEVSPSRIIYLSCNPVTQARDTAILAEKYGIKYHMGYNFFPRTPHIENLVILDLKK